jgi:hypothetical protein
LRVVQEEPSRAARDIARKLAIGAREAHVRQVAGGNDQALAAAQLEAEALRARPEAGVMTEAISAPGVSHKPRQRNFRKADSSEKRSEKPCRIKLSEAAAAAAVLSPSPHIDLALSTKEFGAPAKASETPSLLSSSATTSAQIPSAIASILVIADHSTFLLFNP